MKPPSTVLSIDQSCTYFESLARSLQILTPEAWYDIQVNQFGRNKLARDVLPNKHCLSDCLKNCYPEYKWQRWKFKYIRDYWDHIENQKEFLDWVGEQLGIDKPTQWYAVSMEEIIQRGGHSLVARYSKSMSKMLCTVYDELGLLPWMFEAVPRTFWDEPEHEHWYMQWMAEQLNVHSPEDWYAVNHSQLIRARSVLNKHGDSLSKVLVDLYSEYEWHLWRFEVIPQGMWDQPQIHRRYLEWLGTQLHFTAPQDWYKLQWNSLLEHKGLSLLFKYGTSIYSLISSVFTEYTWYPWLFSTAPHGFWDQIANQRSYLNWLGEKMNVEKPEDWYRVRKEDVVHFGGRALLSKYNESFAIALMKIYPNYPWKPWLSSTIPKNLFSLTDTLAGYVEWVEKKLCIRTPEDWYEVSSDHLEQLQRSAILRTELVGIIKQTYPQYKWQESAFQSGGKRTQKLLWRMVKSLMPSNTVVNMDYSHPFLYYYSDTSMQFDIFVPSLALALEYNGQQHYERTSLFGAPVEQQHRDSAKKLACQKANISLIEIPFTWGFDIDSIATSIRDLRPDIQLNGF